MLFTLTPTLFHFFFTSAVVMSPSARSFARLLALVSALSVVSAQVTGTYPPTPLASLHYAYPTGIVSLLTFSSNLPHHLPQPYQADSNVGLIRGTQFGYNICNSTTENQQSNCQTSFLNAIDGNYIVLISHIFLIPSNRFLPLGPTHSQLCCRRH